MHITTTNCSAVISCFGKVSTLLLFLFAPLLSWTQVSDLIISEYGEGSSGNRKYVEIYNGTGATVNLSDYQLWRISNGGTWPGTATYSFTTSTLANGATIVVANNSTDVPGADEYSGFASWNGDDAVGLAKNMSGFTLIDAVGEEGPDPGSGWTVDGTPNGTRDNVLVRNANVCAPNTDWTNSSANEWTVFSYSSDPPTTMGSHTESCSSSCSITGVSTGVVSCNGLNAEFTVSFSATGASGSYNVINATTLDVLGSGMSTSILASVPNSIGGTINIQVVDAMMGTCVSGTVPVTLVDCSTSSGTDLNSGDMLIVGFDTYVDAPDAGADIVLITPLVDLAPGTDFIIANVVYELGTAPNEQTGRFYSGNGNFTRDPAYFRIIYTGAANISAGALICFTLPSFIGDPSDFTINGTPSSDFATDPNSTGFVNVSSSVSNPDAIFLMQGTFSSVQTDLIGKYALFGGDVLSGFQFRANFYRIDETVPSSGRVSRIHPDIECLSVEITNTAAASFTYYNSTAIHSASQRDILAAVSNTTANWVFSTTSGSSGDGNNLSSICTSPTFTVTSTLDQTVGRWIGNVSGDASNYFNCANWGAFTVPDRTVDVEIPAGTPTCIIDENANFADRFGEKGECNDLNIQGSAVQVQTELEIYGDLTINGNLSYGGTGTPAKIEFLGTSVQDVSGAGNSSINSMEVNGAGLNLLRSLSVDDELGLTTGLITLNTNNFTINSGGTISGGSGASYIQTNNTGVLQQEVGAVNVNFPLGRSTYNPAILNNENGTTSNFQLRVFDEVLTMGTSGTPFVSAMVNRTWLIEQPIPATLSLDITLQWEPGHELGAFTRNDCFISHYHSMGWDGGITGIAAGSDPYTQSRADITSLSPFAVQSGIFLNTTLEQFTAKKIAEGVLLEWRMEQANAPYFVVEHSLDGIKFEPIAWIEQNASSTHHTYIHQQPAFNYNYYRISWDQEDGALAYSSIESVSFDSPEISIDVFPTLVQETLQVRLNNPKAVTNMQICNVLGQYFPSLIPSAISETTSINVDGLNAGTYLLILTTKDQKIVRRFIKK